MRTLKGIASMSLIALGLLLLGGAVAQASAYVPIESFGEHLKGPLGVAIDPTSSDVYVGNYGSYDEIQKFTAEGERLAPPSPIGGFGEEEFAFYAGVAVDPTNGRVFAYEAGLQQVIGFEGSTGAKVTSTGVAGAGEYMRVQIASDSTDAFYIPVTPENEVRKYRESQQGLVAGQTFTGSGANALKEPTGVAVSPSENVYVADDGNGRVEEFNPTGTVIGSIPAPGVQSVAVNAAGEVFAGELNSEDSCEALPAPCFHVVVYSPAGVKLADFGAGTFAEPERRAIDTLAVGPTGLVYVTDGAANLVRVYGQQSKPSLLSVSSSAVTRTTAGLDGRIAENNSPTSYRFEYGPTAAYGSSIPVPEKSIGLVGPTLVSQELTGLQPGTTYHYRLIATNTLGENASPDETFTTPLPQPPIVSTGPAVAVAQNSATLTATIETQGFETVYEFDLGADTSYGIRIFGDAGAEPGTQTFTVPLQDLQPETTYHYRIQATNTFGTSYGVDQSFTTGSYPSSALSPPTTAALLPTSLLAPTSAIAAASGAHVSAVARPARETAGAGKRSAGRSSRHRKGRPSSRAGHAHDIHTGRERR
jgi:hypothetical protein